MNDDTNKQTGNNGSDGRDGSGRFAPGSPGGPGRPVGSPNRVTTSMRDLVERSVHERHPDGAVAWLNSLPDALFVRLVARLLPANVEAAGEDGEPIQPIIVMYGSKKYEEAIGQESSDDAEADTSGLT